MLKKILLFIAVVINNLPAEELQRLDQIILKIAKDPRFETIRPFEDVLYIEGQDPQFKGAIIAATHGNEPVGVSIVSRILESIFETGDKPAPSLYFVLANRPAYLKQQRFVDCDLNRQYGAPSLGWEGERAKSLAKLLDTCAFSIDFHQTVEPTRSAFFVVPAEGPSIKLAAHLKKDLPVIMGTLSKSAKTSSAYVAKSGGAGLTLELTGGDAFDKEALSLGLEIYSKIAAMQDLPLNDLPESTLEVVAVGPYNGGTVHFREGLWTMDKVNKGEKIGTVDEEDLLAQETGYILLYPRVMLQKDLKPLGTHFVLQESSL